VRRCGRDCRGAGHRGAVGRTDQSGARGRFGETVARQPGFALATSIALQHYINAAQGYLELGMTDEALAELERVPEEDRDHEDVAQLRVYVLMRARRWDDALVSCEALRAARPELSLGYIHGAFCLHELGRTAEAMELLQQGPASLLREPVYFYNLGCYHAVLGNPEDAQSYLQMSFNMDEKFREIARYDPDLEGVMGKLA
jgi:tetratricopeptide (TPR) repeat protein